MTSKINKNTRIDKMTEAFIKRFKEKHEHETKSEFKKYLEK
jgi:hypothetical protein